MTKGKLGIKIPKYSKEGIAGREDNTAKPVYSGHLRFVKKVSAITKCPL